MPWSGSRAGPRKSPPRRRFSSQTTCGLERPRRSSEHPFEDAFYRRPVRARLGKSGRCRSVRFQCRRHRVRSAGRTARGFSHCQISRLRHRCGRCNAVDRTDRHRGRRYCRRPPRHGRGDFRRHRGDRSGGLVLQRGGPSHAAGAQNDDAANQLRPTTASTPTREARSTFSRCRWRLDADAETRCQRRRRLR